MNTLIICESILAVAALLGVCVFYLHRISKDMRAIREVLQAHWDYEMVKIKWKAEASRLTSLKTSREATQQHEPAKESC